MQQSRGLSAENCAAMEDTVRAASAHSDGALARERDDAAGHCGGDGCALHAAVKNGCCVCLIMPMSNTACFQAFLQALARNFARQDILLVLDGAPNHRCGDLADPANITLLYLPPYSPELNPKQNLWDEIREKLFKNCALKSIRAVRAKLT
jgi:transposase